MLVCPHCHQFNAETNKFCLYCGTPLVPPAPVENELSSPTSESAAKSSSQQLGAKGTAELAWSELGEMTWTPDLLTAANSRPGDQPPSPANLPPNPTEADSPQTETPVSLPVAEAYPGDDELTLIPDAIDIQEISRDLLTNFGSQSEPISAVVVYPCDSDSPWLACERRPDLPPVLEQDTERQEGAIFLDEENRYRCLTSFSLDTTSGRVEDTQPSRPTRVLEFSQTLIQQADQFDLTQPQEMLTQLQARPDAPTPIVISYLSLRLLFSEFVPRLQDAWVGYGTGQPGIHEPRQFVVLQDRSQCPSLWQAWQDPELDNGQLLAWMEEMIDLWPNLEAWGCAASLLDEDNLCIYGEGILAVRYLDFSPLPDPSPQGLIALWQSLLSQAPASRQQAFQPLFVMLQTQPQQTLADIQALIEQLWETLQSDLINLGNSQDFDLKNVVASLDAHWQQDLNSTPAQAITEDSPTAVLPKQLVQLDTVGLTDTGRQRHHNEDFFLIDHRQHYCGTSIGQKLQARGLYVLCDGMGGHAQGEVASSLAASTVFNFFQEHWLEGEPLPEDEVIRQAIFAANQAIFNHNEDQRTIGSGRMGTTLVLALVHNQAVCLAHVGDSRAYRFTRRHGLEQLSVDHEVGQRDIKRGVEPEIAYARPDAYQLTQALGPRGNDYLNPDILTLEVTDDTVFLLCSDGLTDNDCLESHIESHVAPLLSFDSSLSKGVRTLINLGNEHNGHDNLTVIAIRMKLRSELDQIF
ncbi:serine/threonine phosphatase [Synechococcus sp. PCC 6312]|uniref:serine/threonine phosphatase n=1 Tax=Synechococcus sp. (strain ATCC 27167 / PCC 6312) TaxID=195253 RepID=UPI00029EFF20|nr:serine/threonine phosphatase [Synechococcus sp. PCC 6312]AFY60765.1 serine/threonine protein phosphatase [Synechococcus sp. PCC 6312]